MDPKIITGLVLWFCFIASLSISQTDAARIQLRQRFRREADESVACPEGTKPCKDDNNICVAFCDGNLDCTDGSDEVNCATSASATSTDANAFAPTIQANGNEIERVNIPEGATDITEATLPQITLLDRETAAPATAEPAANEAASEATTQEGETAAAAVEGTTAALPADTTAQAATEAEATEAAGGEATTAAGAAATEASEGGATTEAAGEAATTEAAGEAATTQASEGGASTGAAGEAATTEASEGGASTEAAGEAATTEASEGGASTEAAGEAATTEASEGGASTEAAGEAATTEASEGGASTEAAGEAATTEASEGGASTEAAGEAATTETVTGHTEAAEESATTDADKAEASTEASDASSAAPENGHGEEDHASTASAVEGTTSDDSATHEATTVNDVTAEVTGATSATDDATKEAGSDVTTSASDVTVTGGDVIATTVIDAGAVDDNATHVSGGEEVTTAAPVPPQPDGRVELRVVVNPEILEVQRGRTYELTCTVYGADATTTIYWIQEEPERRYALIDEASPDDKQVTMSQVSLKARITLDDPSKIGKYTCMAQDTSGNSGAAILTMQESHYIHPVFPPIVPVPNGGQGYLRIVAPDMVDGDYVEINCEGAAPEDEGRIQWFFNNRLLSDENPLYPRGKTLHIRPISRPYLGTYRCSIPGSRYADANSVLTFGGPVPSTDGPSYGFSVTVQIVQGQTAQGQVQENSQVVLRCQPSEQATSYRWTFTTNQGAVNRGYTDQLVIPQATTQDSGLYTCEADNSRGQSASGSVNVYVVSAPTQPISGRCSIDEATCRNGRCIPRAYLYDGKNDCGDNSDEAASAGGDGCQPNEIRCVNSDRGRKCVQKFWMCDGDRDCDDGSDEEQRYCELLPRQRYCKPSEFHCGGSNATTSNPVCIPRSFQCDGYNDCPDRSDEIGCVKPVVVVAPQRQIHVHVGQTLTIQCTARGSPAPYINWRLNWGHVCGDGSDNGRCSMTQSLDSSDPSLVTGTLTVRNVNAADGGAYSCEALNNQGFIFAIPDAIVDVIIDATTRATPCYCNDHSSTCSSDGRCLNCQHNTAGNNCEFCAPGFQGDARRGTPYDCQPTATVPSTPRCDPSGTHMERGGRCICKYNVEGDRCDRCKRGHFYMNPTTPNGCLPCFCSGVSTECSSTEWRRLPMPLSLNNWNAIPKNFATDSYEARNQIRQRNGGSELSLDQSSLGRPASEVLYWKAPKEVLGNVVTLYDGNIDIHFTNDGNDNEAPSNDEFLWLRGNNIDIVHKLPQTQRFSANSNSTYSVPVNERTFTRKDGTYIDRENILMALSDLDTLLVKINPIDGRSNAVLRGVTLNVANRGGYSDAAPTVESCRCPANYTGTSCEKCAEGYGRPHPLVGIYLGQCWSCRSLCNDRSDRCDADTGKCLDCQANSEGDRCERCRAGFILDPRLNQCVRGDPSSLPPSPSSQGSGSGNAYYFDNKPHDPYGAAPLTITLDGNLPEQRLPLQVLNSQPQSVVWGRTDGSPLPLNVVQEGNDLVFRNPSAEQAGNYIVTITNPDGNVDRIGVLVQYRQGQRPPTYGQNYPPFSPPSPLALDEGSHQLIQPHGLYQQVYWRRDDGTLFPYGVSQNGNALQISGARSEHSGVYYCDLRGTDGSYVSVPYVINVRSSQPVSSGVGAPRITIEPKTINLKEGQRMIVQYTVSSHDPIDVFWNKRTDHGYQPIPSLFTVEPNRLVLHRATPDAAGVYQVIVRNRHGEDRQELRINVEPRRGRGRDPQSAAPRIRFQQDQYEIGAGEIVDVVPTISGASGSRITWSKDGSASLPEGVTAHGDGALRFEGRGSNIDGRYTLEVANAYGTVSSPITIRWKEPAGQFSGYGYGQDDGRSYIAVRFASQDERNHQVGRDIYLQCSVQGSVERPYEYTYTKDGRPLENNVEIHPNGLILIRNAQASDSGRYRCEVAFPNAPQAGIQESSYDLRVDDAHGGAYSQGYQQGNEYQVQSEYVEASVEPSEANIGIGEKANLTCRVKGAQHYTVTWTKYAHDTSLPTYARQQGNSVLLAPTNDSPSEQMYLQCSVQVSGQSQPILAYAPVTVRGTEELMKKKKKRRS